jgi:tetratricopeptide (TPR) repeat protein
VADSDLQTGVTGFDEHEQLLVTGGELLRQNRVKEARDQFRAALQARPEDAKALGLLGLACFRLGDFTSALPIYQKLVVLTPEDASHRLNLGLVCLKLGLPDDAIRELERCRNLDPSQTRAVGYLGLAYARSGRYADAYQAFMQAGQNDLALEMSQYLDEAERARLDRSIVRAPSAEPVSEEQVEDELEELRESDLEEVSVEDRGPRAPSRDNRAKGNRSEVVEIEPRRPQDGAPTAELDERGAISRALDEAAPSSSAAAAATRTAAGHRPPQTLSEFATARLIRPEDGDHAFEISAGGVLIVRVSGRVFTRTEGVNVTGGELAYEIATRRERGRKTAEAFGADGRKLFAVSGKGHLVAAPLGEQFTAVTLDDDIFYLREELVFAFEEQLRWENGHVPGSDSAIPMVQFRGQGSVAFRSPEPLLAVKLAPEKVLYVDADILAGWIGRVVPRIVAPAAAKSESSLFVECTGEGVVLVEEEGAVAADDDAASALPPAAAPKAARAAAASAADE